MSQVKRTNFLVNFICYDDNIFSYREELTNKREKQ